VALARLRSISRARMAALAAAALLAGLGCAQPARAAAPVPARFFGVVAEPDLLTDTVLAPAGTTLEEEMDDMVGAGVGSVRASFFWARIQPYRSWAEVPGADASRFTDVAGSPFDFTQTDRMVAGAAARRLALLPVLLWPPAWAARHPGEFASPPADPAVFASYAAVLAKRYGPGGVFWRDNPQLARVPIRDWQLWNEPTMRAFWLDQPFASRYVRLLRATRPALRRVDPRARVVLGGLVYDSPGALRALYKAGARRWFDVAAIHPFTLHVAGVATIVAADRALMAANGDRRKPLFLTEVSWPSAKGKTPSAYGYEMTESGQAARLAQALPYLAARRHELGIERVYWYSWLTREVDPMYPFDYAGLRRLEPNRVVSKPAFSAYRRTALRLQGCKSKSARGSGKDKVTADKKDSVAANCESVKRK
jgi:polysaccharide biosynthesis protein PslG